MELKLVVGSANNGSNVGLNRTFYGIETKICSLTLLVDYFEPYF